MSNVLADFLQSPGACSSLSLSPFLWGLPPSQLDPRPSALSRFPCTPLLQRSQTRGGERLASTASPFSPGPVLRTTQAPGHCGGSASPGAPKQWLLHLRSLPGLHPIPAHRVCSHTGWSSLPFCVTPCSRTGPHSYVLTSCRVFGSSVSPEMLAWETDWVSASRPCAGAHFLPFPLTAELCGPVWLLSFQVGSPVSQCTWSR